MKRIFLLSILIIASITYSYSQEEEFFSDKSNKQTEKPKRKLERWSFGGNFWLSVGTSSYIEASPVAMYKFTPKFMAGPGFTYFFQSSKYYDYKTSSYGPKVLASYTLLSDLHETINLNIGNIILYTEYEYLNLEKIYGFPNGGSISEGRTWVSTYLLGGGIFQPIGRGGISILVLYNFLENDYTPYSNPVIRFGFYF